MRVRFFTVVLMALLLASSACSFSGSNTGRKVALIRAQDVEILTVNGTRIDRDSRAVLVVAGRNELTFQWPTRAHDFRIPATYRVIMNAIANREYVITPHPKSGFLCAWESSKENGIDFTRHSGCVRRQPS